MSEDERLSAPSGSPAADPGGGSHSAGLASLVHFLHDGADPQDRADAAITLGDYQRRDVTDALIQAVGTERDTLPLLNIVHALDRIGDPRALHALTKIARWDINSLNFHAENVVESAISAVRRLRTGRP